MGKRDKKKCTLRWKKRGSQWSTDAPHPIDTLSEFLVVHNFTEVIFNICISIHCNFLTEPINSRSPKWTEYRESCYLRGIPFCDSSWRLLSGTCRRCRCGQTVESDSVVRCLRCRSATCCLVAGE